MFAEAAAQADVLLLGGDLTDYGLPEEARVLARELSGVTIPMLGVLGNHDFESGHEEEVVKILVEAGVQMLDGDSVEVDGVGFVGVKGFGGGFGRRTLEPWGEVATKAFVNEAVAEALKLERALARLVRVLGLTRGERPPEPGRPGPARGEPLLSAEEIQAFRE